MDAKSVYIEFQKELWSYIRSKVKSRDDAEDILQNTFLKIASGILGLADETKVRSWVFTVTRNTIVDYYRRKGDSGAVVDIDSLANTSEIDEAGNASSMLNKCVGAMIGLLPPEDRDIILESEIRGTKQKDLAEKYGIPYPSMRSRVQRGRDKLKKLFYNCCHIDTDVRGGILDVRAKTDGSGCGTSGCEHHTDLAR
jgi:RNA polymerase sigma-70 factor, ECF subfamily